MSLAESRSPGAMAQLGLFLARKGRRVWPLTITGKGLITPRLMRVTFQGADLDELVWKRGQDLVLELPTQDEHPPAVAPVDGEATLPFPVTELPLPVRQAA